MNNECKNGKCDFDTSLNRKAKFKRSKAEIRYARLWAEIELPKLLRGEEIE